MHKHTIIVGGTHGTGKILACTLAKRGEQVSVIGRRAVSGHELGADEISVHNVDITDPVLLPLKLKTLCEASGGDWTSLVFFQKYRGNDDEWEGEWHVSLDATKRIVDWCTAAAEVADKHPRAIVVIGSIAGRTIVSDQNIAYHAAKAALEHMVRYWAVKLGPLGIRVNMVSPHAVLKEESAAFYLSYTRLMDLYKKIIPLGRMGTSKEVVQVVDFLCSPSASYVTGQNILVDGGISLVMQEGPVRAALHMEC